MTKHEWYKFGHENYNILPGDIVRVLRPASDQEMGWPLFWTYSMDELIGGTFTVAETPINGIVIRHGKQKWQLPFFVLEVVGSEIMSRDGHRLRPGFSLVLHSTGNIGIFTSDKVDYTKQTKYGVPGYTQYKVKWVHGSLKGSVLGAYPSELEWLLDIDEAYQHCITDRLGTPK